MRSTQEIKIEEFNMEDEYDEGFIHKYSAEIFSYLTILLFGVVVFGIGLTFYFAQPKKQVDWLENTIQNLKKDIAFSA